MRRGWAWLAAIGLIVIFALWLGGETGAVSSALSRGGRGWLTVQRYLIARGARVQLRDRPLTDVAEQAEDDPGVLVLAFPWQLPVSTEELEALGEFLRRRGTVVLAYSGETAGFLETRVLEALDLELFEVRPEPPLAPMRWWAYHNASWSLEPTAAWAVPRQTLPPQPPVSLQALRTAPEAPHGARALYRLPSGEPLIFDYPLHRGRVIALPASVLSNAHIAEDGNADLLESLHGWLGDDWSFDEYHHGLVAPESIPESTSRFAWDLFIGHLVLIYLLGLATLARRFGPVWREAPVADGSTASFLRNLGVLHRDLSHHGAAAALLVDRARAYDPALPLDAETSERAKAVADAGGLVELAREISRAQRRRSNA